MFHPGMLLGIDQRYRIDRLLGRGGFSEVYLAEDSRLDRLCVIKRLRMRPEWPAEVALQVRDGFAREARLLASLNTPGNAHIPEIYDHLDDQLCLVMKYIQGESLSSQLARRTAPLPEEEALRYVRAICDALIYMHSRAEPALHHDIKPANVMIDSTGTIWLIDFGLARSLPAGANGDSTHTLAGGTRGYAPPEQWRGASEPRSDVYALVATLYELLTRRRPLADAAEPLPNVRQINPAVRPEVERLIMRGLAPDVAARPTAAGLLAELEALLAPQQLAPPEPERPPAIPALVGRGAELEALVERLGATRFAVLTGMAGVGKTTLAAAIALRYASPEQLFWHTFQANEGVDTLLWLLAGWLARAGRPDAWQQLQRAQESGGPQLTPDLVADYLIQLMRGQAGLLCFDDLHVVADDAAIMRVIGRLAAAALLDGPALVATTRILPATLKTSPILALQGLNELETAALLKQAGLKLTDHLVHDLFRSTEGNPQFLVLAIAALRRAADPAVLMAHLLEVSDLGGYLLREVDAGLTKAERRVMEAVAVFQGYGGSQDAIKAVLDGTQVWRMVTRLCERHLLTIEPRADGPLYRQHAIVQSFYYATLASRRLRTLHGRAADYYEEIGDLLSAARHAALAGRHGHAAELLTRDIWGLIARGQARTARALLDMLPLTRLEPGLRAAAHTAQGEILVILGEYAAARTVLEQALAEGAGQDVQQARRHRLLARLYEHSGAFEQAELHCRQGLALAEGPAPIRTETARLYDQLAEVLMRRNDFDAALTACRAGLVALPPEPATPAERGALLLRLAAIEGRRGAYRPAIAMLERSLSLARQAGTPILTATVLYNLGYYFQVSGQIEQALACFTESLHLTEQVGDLVRRLTIINGLGAIHRDLEQNEAALQCFEECRALSERFHLPEPLAFAMLNIGGVRYEQAQLAEAEEQLQQARRIFQQLGSLDEESHSLYMLGDVALKRGDPATAERYGQAALALARQVGSDVFESCALRVLGEARLARGELAAADLALEQAWQLQEQIGDPFDQALIQAARARLALLQGDHTRARTEAQASLHIAQARGITYLEQELIGLLGQLQSAEEQVTESLNN